MFKWLIRISAFLGKELIEIVRQPRLILTLVLGPFLIMFLFGLASPDQSRALRTTFVATDPNAVQEELKLFTESYKAGIIDMGVETNKELALSQLAAHKTDLVIVIPDNPLETIQDNKRAELEIYHNEVDPIQTGYIETIALIYVNVVNRQILETVTEQGQADSDSLQTNLETAITKTQLLRKTIALSDVNTATQAAELEKDLTDVHENLTTFRSLTSTVMVNPFSGETYSLSEVEFTVTEFFAPSVIALILQHLSITFACLSIVREKRSGIMELFRVAPITAFEALMGKYISYLLFEIILAGLITALAVWVLKIPMLGQWQDYALAVVIVLFTSLGVGFFISLISETDTQAVQYSMLLLLASIFFSGFLMDLRLIKEPITILSWSLPATYGIRMLQDIMLRGSSIPVLIFQGVALIGIALFLVDWLLLRKKMDS
ncbi:MAG: ABC transporter permease [Anaerolineales bacterium]|nr:ABC transporter permease [Anaerolineales bacterium]